MLRPQVLVFGEDDNDRRALVHLMQGIISKDAIIKQLRRPIILPQSATSRKRRSMASDIAAFWKFERREGRRVIVVVHRDCDATEPAHISLSLALEKDLNEAGVSPVVPATPAWEIEAWWMLFPEAVSATRGCWRRISYSGSVGVIENAKERLRRDLRPASGPERSRCPDYTESDGIKIAEKIARGGIPANVGEKSASLAAFRDKLVKAMEMP